MRQLVSRFLNHGISRRDFVRRLTGLGLTATAVAAILDGAITISQAVTALMTRPLKTETND